MNHLLILLISIPCVLGAECQRGDTSCSCETDTGTTAYFSTFKFISKSENNAENTYSAKCGISRNQCGSGYTSKIPAPTCCKNCCKSTECKCKAELCIYPKCPVSSKPFTGFTGKQYNNKNHNELTADKCGCGDSNLKQCLIGQICSASTTKPKTCNCCSKGGTVTMNGQCTCRAGGATCSSGGLCTYQNGDYGPDGCNPPGSVTATCSYPSCPMDGFMWEGGKTIGSKECRCLLDDSCVNTNDEKGCKTWYKYPCKCSSTTNCDVGYVCNGQTGACTKCTDVSCDGGCQRAGNCEKGSAGEEGTGDNSNSNSGGSSPTCTADELTTMQQCVEKVSAEMQNNPTSTSDSDSSSKSDSDSSSSSDSASITKPGGRALDSSSSDSSSSDSDTSCKLYQDMLACYPACYCDDSLNENKINDILASNRESALSKGIMCTLKCGGSSSSSGDEDGDKASHATKMMLSAFAIASVVIAASFSTHYH